MTKERLSERIKGLKRYLLFLMPVALIIGFSCPVVSASCFDLGLDVPLNSGLADRWLDLDQEWMSACNIDYEHYWTPKDYWPCKWCRGPMGPERRIQHYCADCDLQDAVVADISSSKLGL